MARKQHNAADLFNFYIHDEHWLHMDRDKMLIILMGLRESMTGTLARHRWQEAYDLVKNSTPDEVGDMKVAYYEKYRGVFKPDSDSAGIQRFRDEKRKMVFNLN